MKYFYSVLFSLFFIISCQEEPKNTIPLENGVSLRLAAYRKEHISSVNYALSFNIPKALKDPVISKLDLSLKLKSLENHLYLDFKAPSNHLKSVKVNDVSISILHKDEHIKIPKEYLSNGENNIKIDFLAGEQSLNRNEDFLYTLLVPDRARTLFPCFDQPNIKATYKLQITAPKNWTVLCGGKGILTTEKGEFTQYDFMETDAMSTYLFSFVAGKFDVKKYDSEKRVMNMIYRETNQAKINFSTTAIFDLHEQSLDFLKEYTAYPYPFQKFDFATIPGFQYGGMEHVGAIQYRESALFLDESATENQKLRRAKLIAHETSHMWFGDLVTMDWFNDVWMKEVFANFMADKIANPAFPDINHDLAFLLAHYPSAYSEDRTLGTNPIRQPLNNLNNAGALYGRIIYNKAPIMMRQLEKAMEKESFKKGIQEYIAKYANSNAVWDDLIQLLDSKTTLNIGQWSQVWVNNPGRPIFNDTITYDGDGNIASFEITQNAEDKSNNVWPQKFNIDLVYLDSIHSVSIDMKGKNILLKQLKGLAKPKSIIYNSDGLGYGVFPIHKESLNAIPKIKNPVTRGHTYINLYENTLNGAITVENALQLYTTSLLTEKNELLSNLLSNYITSLFWTFLGPEKREQYQISLTTQLWQQLNSDIPANIKKSLFRIYRSLSFKEETREKLFLIWEKKTSISNLKLNSDDYTAIALQLSLFEHPKQKEILEKTAKSITNPDKLERFKFLLPSVSKGLRERNTFFTSLAQKENRVKEAWVLTALGYLNHPLRHATSIENLRESLNLLDEVQKTGDIFFPKGWLNNTIGNYSSKEAYKILQAFITENPNLNPALMKKLLQASDNLRRVQLLNNKRL